MSCFVGGQKPASETLIRFHHPQTVLSIAEAKSNERSPLMEGRQGRGGNTAEGEWGGLGDDFHGWEVVLDRPENKGFPVIAKRSERGVRKGEDPVLPVAVARCPPGIEKVFTRQLQPLENPPSADGHADCAKPRGLRQRNHTGQARSGLIVNRQIRCLFSTGHKKQCR